MATATEINVDRKRMMSLLCCALEGGSNYWIHHVRCVLPPTHTEEDYKKGGKHNIDDLFDNDLYNCWLYEGGKLVIFVDYEDGTKPKKHELTWEKAMEGLRLMREAKLCHSRYWMEFARENEDADVADVWLQLSILGECVFG